MAVDFKNSVWIVTAFNRDCTQNGRKYLEAKELDNNKEMAKTLEAFGTNLGKVSEWTVKYLLYQYDNLDYEGTDLSFHSLWQKLISGSLMPKLKQLGFSIDINQGSDYISQKNVRDIISNHPKHDGKMVDYHTYWENCILVYNDLYRLIRNFVVNNRTDTLEPLITGDRDWEGLFRLVNGFHKDNDFKYFLLTDRPVRTNCVDLFRIPWSVILDFDYDSSEDGGLFYQSQHLKTGCSSEQYDLGDKVRKRCDLIHWVNVMQRNTEGEKLHDKALKIRIDKKFKAFIESYHSFNTEPIIVVISMRDSNYVRSMNKLLELIQSEYYSEDGHGNVTEESNVKFILLCGSSEQPGIEFDGGTFFPFDISLSDMIIGAKKGIVAPSSAPNQILLPAQLEESKTVEFDEDAYMKLKQFAELVYIGIENVINADVKMDPEDYFKGKTLIQWDMVADDSVVVKPAVYYECISKLKSIREMSGGSHIRFYYRRGIGGTTIIRQLAWDFHTQCPTIILNSYTKDNTANEIQKLYNYCKIPVLIFVDSNNIINENVDKLHNELKSRTLNYVIVHLIGIYEHYKKHGAFPILDNFTVNDMKKLFLHLDNYTKGNPEQHARLQSLPTDAKTPFDVCMHVFEKEFRGVDAYVQNTFQFPTLNGDERDERISELKDILFAVALASWAGIDVEEQLIKDAFGFQNARMLKKSSSLLAPLVIYEKRGECGYFRIRHFRFSESILKLFSESKEGISFTKLSQRIIDFIKRTRRSEESIKSVSCLNLLVRLFIKRDWDIADFSDTIASRNQSVYSPLVKKMIDETDGTQGYSTETDSIVKIYKTLVNGYPDEVHFRAHLSRYYFYTAKDFDNGFQTIKQAINLVEETDNQDRSTLAHVYHIAGMGYRSYVQERLVELDRLMKQLNDPNAKKAELGAQIKALLPIIHKHELEADRLFELSGKEGDRNLIYSLISSCQMHIQILHRYNELQKSSTKHDLSGLVDESEITKAKVILQNKAEQLKDWNSYYMSIEDGDSLQREFTMRRIEYIITTVQELTEEEAEILEYCMQCLSNGSVQNKALYRQVIARRYERQIESDYETEESQSKLKAIIELYESNMDEVTGNASDLINWFNAVRHLATNQERSILILEECEEKLDRWIENGCDRREIFLYRYIVRFLRDYENNSLRAIDSFKILEELELEFKHRSGALPYKTSVLYWVCSFSYGLGRLVTNADFRSFNPDQKVNSLEKFEGRLPSRENFSENTAFISMMNHKVFFSPNAISSRLTVDNAGDFVNFGFGFSFDGLRSYYDSIQRIRRTTKPQEHHSGEYVRVCVIQHNSCWVECVIEDDDQPVIISKSNLKPPFDPDRGIWPEMYTVLEVMLLQQRDYTLHGSYYEKNSIVKKPYLAECP